jgi:hypothetical protein
MTPETLLFEPHAWYSLLMSPVFVLVGVLAAHCSSSHACIPNPGIYKI